MLVALIPAAGQSTRMGRPKLTLPLGDRTVIEWTLLAFVDADVVPCVILQPGDAALAAVVERSGGRPILLSAATGHMRETVEAGLDFLERCNVSSHEPWWFLSPADHPSLDSRVVRVLASVRGSYLGRSIFLPISDGKRGHPTLLHWSHVEGIRRHPGHLGINAYIRSQSDVTQEVPVAAQSISGDVDTPEDYRRIVEEWPT